MFFEYNRCGYTYDALKLASGGSNGTGGSATSGGYRYGFNGNENDDEVKGEGEGNQQDRPFIGNIKVNR